MAVHLAPGGSHNDGGRLRRQHFERRPRREQPRPRPTAGAAAGCRAVGGTGVGNRPPPAYRWSRTEKSWVRPGLFAEGSASAPDRGEIAAPIQETGEVRFGEPGAQSPREWCAGQREGSPQGGSGEPRFRRPGENGVGKTQPVSEGKDGCGYPARRREAGRRPGNLRIWALGGSVRQESGSAAPRVPKTEAAGKSDRPSGQWVFRKVGLQEKV